ncbi:poly-gamma-glutamate biosynthesis protein PgsC/CapC [Kineococcus xinjiangensis]|uniref:Poly-gamma-glutamate biosynthesis protein PgsC/CapC n=1 Tax=Kineococcus xinjiangensis TaxID=512762 RepID=A0A2S6IMG6_9ACTN|nr:poly-gamma-glutamate biosynthesis protein PgsC/CapC [Kineococcus xinjiangensis]PPK95381.1 poly-gamma-glutamate biosynthesis protein PgsC/CapC [Kineococcus xinjiangensis]
MHEYLFRPEVVRVALIVGVVVSVLFYERVQLTTGGAIVPAYLAVSLPAPLHVASTLLAGYVTYLVVTVLLSRRFILYGRRKFEVEVLVGLAVGGLLLLAATAAVGLHPALYGIAALGFLVPGILAHDMSRQRAGRTVVAVLVTTGILGLVVYQHASLLAIVPGAGGGAPAPAPPAGYARELVMLAAAASVLLGMLTFARLGLRSGGFVSAAYLALVAPRWADLVFALAVAALTWLVVVKGLMPRLLIFGRRKLSTMVLVGGVLAWTAELLLTAATGGEYVPWRDLTVMSLMVPALLANDAQRQGWERTLWGAALTTTGVYAVMNLATAAGEGLGLL